MGSVTIETLENLCRTCMAEQASGAISNDTGQNNKSLISIYEAQDAMDRGYMSVIDLLNQTSPQLTVKPDDLLPKNICESCLDTLFSIHKFQTNSLRVEQRLRDIVKEHFASHGKDLDPLNKNIEDIENETLMDIATPVKGFFTLHEKDGQIIEVYHTLETCEGNTSDCSEKCDTKDDAIGKCNPECDTTATSEASITHNNSLPSSEFWKYIQEDVQDEIPSMKEQDSKGETFADGEVNSLHLKQERKEIGIDNRTRTLRRSKRKLKNEVELLDESNNRIQNRNNVDEDSESKDQPTAEIRNDMKTIAEEESLERELSDCNEKSEVDSEWEPPLDKSERVKSQSINIGSNIPVTDNIPKPHNIDPKYDDYKYVCVKCKKRLKTRLGLTRHLRRHLIKKQKPHNATNGHTCPECGMRLKTRITFKRHLLWHRNKGTKTQERPYLCSICGKSYPTTHSLKLHSERHDGEYKYQCPECPKRFRSKSNLTTHKAIVHTTLRPHVCDVCGASFKKPYGLTKHKINHGERKHKCDYCEQKFSHSKQREVHMRTHTGEKPYKCKYCERSYSQSSEVMKHLRVHIGDNVYRCEMCPLAFPLLREMRLHFITHNNDDEETKLQNLKALKEEEERIEAKIQSQKATKT